MTPARGGGGGGMVIASKALQRILAGYSLAALNLKLR